MGYKEHLDDKMMRMLDAPDNKGQTNPVMLGTREGLIHFYKNQLKKFVTIGIGKKTENNVTITPHLLDITIKRLKELETTLRHKPMKEWG